MRFKDLSFGSIQIDGVTDEHDVATDWGAIRKRKEERVTAVLHITC